MARPSTAKRLCVYLNARPVGNLDKQGSGAIRFTYHSEWLNWDGSVPVSISLPLRPGPYHGQAVTNVFENLLPDAARVRRNVAQRLGADGTDAFSLLDVVGQDCVGALQFLPEGVDPGDAGQVDGQTLTDADIATVIRQLSVEPLGLSPDDDFRISIAGAQDKTALLRRDGEWARPHGTTATTHIFKPQIGMLPGGIDMSQSVENEFLCLKLCEALGLDVAPATIERFEDQTVLCVERFDRLWASDGRLLRLPQEDFCQALSVPSTRKYQKDGGPGMIAILERLQESDQPVRDRIAFLRSQIVFWLLGATDGHAKNFSIRHTPGGGFSMTPIYDVISVQTAVDAGQLAHNRYKLAMSVGNNNRYVIDRIAPRHFEQTADAAGLPRGSVEAICADLSANVKMACETAYGLIGETVTKEMVASLVGGIQSRSDTLSRA